MLLRMIQFTRQCYSCFKKMNLCVSLCGRIFFLKCTAFIYCGHVRTCVCACACMCMYVNMVHMWRSDDSLESVLSFPMWSWSLSSGHDGSIALTLY